MKAASLLLSLLPLLPSASAAEGIQPTAPRDTIGKEEYLRTTRDALQVKWPENRTLNIVFHGHSVPAGYFVTPDVKTFSSYPMMVHMRLSERYPHAVVNVMNTAIGGENAEKGAARFKEDVLDKKPDIVFIDYALNDRSMGLEKARKHWEEMIGMAIDRNIKVFLMTPTPDKREDILDATSRLEGHARQIRGLAEKFRVGLIDSYALFKERVQRGEKLDSLMSQVNHPNREGHRLVADEIMSWF